MIEIFIFLDKSYLFQINPFESIYNLKEKIYKKLNVPIDQQILHYNGNILKNNKTLIEYQITNK